MTEKKYAAADRIFRMMGVMVGGLVFLYLSYMYSTYVDRREAERQVVICPSFLSISRSARDTLIVMRNEPLCNRYVLENLQ
jgi:hypothetical protein